MTIKSAITVERMETALNFLADTDDEFARLKTDVERSKAKQKAVFAAIYPRTVGTVDERKSFAETDEDHLNAQNDYFDALSTYEKLRNRRETRSLLIDVWRSVNSARNKGQIV